jgi:hypothetical protein
VALVRVVRDADMYVVGRDEQMLAWLGIVRVTNVESIRWGLGALSGWDCPVSVRRAQSWVARMRRAGMVDTVRLGDSGGSVLWAGATA